MQAGLIGKEKVARSSVPASVITSENDLADKVAASRIDTKQFITAQTFVSSDEGVGGAFAQAIATPNLVAVTVNMDVERGVANAIEPGDHVDIAQTTTREGGTPTTEYIMRNVKVLAVGVATVPQSQAAPTAEGGTPAPVVQSGLLTFEVTSEDALRVIEANSGRASPTWCCCRRSSAGVAVEPRHQRVALGKPVESFATVAPGGVETADFDLAVIEPDYTIRTRLAVELGDAASVRDDRRPRREADWRTARRGSLRSGLRRSSRLPACAPAHGSAS